MFLRVRRARSIREPDRTGAAGIPNRPQGAIGGILIGLAGVARGDRSFPKPFHGKAGKPARIRL